MIDNIIKIIGEYTDISGYTLVSTSTSSDELFLIKKDIDMLRKTDTEDIELTVYYDDEKDGKKIRGSSTANISTSMDDDEIRSVIKDAIYAAKFVKNEYYPLAEKTTGEFFNSQSTLKTTNGIEALTEIKSIIYDDYKTDSKVNSSEIFVNRLDKRIVNSNGVDVRFEEYNGVVEVITECDKGAEPVEIYALEKFADIDSDSLSTLIKSRLIEAEERAIAKPTKKLENINVIITGMNVREIFYFYYDQAAASSHYFKTNLAKLSEDFMSDAKGDKVSITLKPMLKNSSASRPFDENGVKLKDVEIFKDGVLKSLHGSLRFTSYMNAPTTGMISNMEAANGSTSVADMKSEPYFEILAFSDIQIDPLTGDLGGEIRLAHYFDGEKTVPVSGGSFTAKLTDIHNNMLLSSEVQSIDRFSGPKHIMFKNVEIMGE